VRPRSSLLLLLMVPALVLGEAAQKPGNVVSRRTGAFQDRRLRESSGVIASRRHPGLLWTLNDSGGDPVLFLTDTTGAALGIYPVRGASNVDWEALGRGSCGAAECLFIGDTGDNSERRPMVRLYRIVEPDTSASARSGTGPQAESLGVQYPDGAHDVEGLYVEPDGAVILVTKGRSGGILTFRVPPSAWGAGRTALATRVDSLPIAPSLMTGRVVTDAAMSPDGQRVAVRTYRDVHFFKRDSAGGLHLDADRPVCDISGREPQGEGLDWWDQNVLVLTSERGGFSAGVITLLRCPGP
jgi:hypothetical protein